jgi:hypothetical protein
MLSPGRLRSPAHLVLAAITLVLVACQEKLTEPTTIVSGLDRSQLWGVAPFENETGTSVVDSAAIADAFMMEAQQVDQIDMVPVNRVIRAMRASGIERIASPGDALTIMNVLRLDALVIGTVTAYDPYRPLTLGLAVEVYARPASEDWTGLDPRELTRSISGKPAAAGAFGPSGPVAQAAGVFNASNHRTLQWLAEYTAGRQEPGSAYGGDIYLVSMDLYTQFVCHRLLHDLLAPEALVNAPDAGDSR